jgi:outer membrane protein TolC
MGGLAAADPTSDLFQPDVLRMGNALSKRTAGLADPAGRDCPLPSGPLSVAAAVDLALCRNPTTRSAWAVAREQASALGIAESARLPTITATGSESRYIGPHTDALGQTVTASQDTKDVAATLTWTLYDFGNRGGRIRNARYLLDAAALTVSRTVQQTVFTTVQAYYTAAAADAAAGSSREAEKTAEKSLEIATTLQQGGVSSRADVLQAETAYDQSVIARIQSEQTAANARGALAVVTGAPADYPLQLEPEPVPDSAPALSARMADLMAEAVRQRPDLGAALSQRDAAEANVTVARATGRPSITVQGSHNVSDTTGIPNLNYNQIGVFVTVPLFSGFNTTYQVRQAQAALEASEANAEQLRLNVSLDVWNGYYALNSANQQLAATAKLTKTAADNEDVALGRYQSGVGSIIDVLTAQTAASTARTIRINAELGWKVARAQLALALGRLTGSQPLADATPLP